MNLKSINLPFSKALTLTLLLLLSAPSYAMNKAELVDAIASNSGLSKEDSRNALDSFIKNTTSILKKKDRVSLVGFGSFSISKRAARTGRNPQTGATIQIKAKYSKGAVGELTITGDGRAEVYIKAERGYLRDHQQIIMVPEIEDEVLIEFGMPIELIFDVPPGAMPIYRPYKVLEYDMASSPLYGDEGQQGENPLYSGADALLTYLQTIRPTLYKNMIISNDLEETADALGFCSDAFVDLEAVEIAMPFGHVTVLKAMAEDTGLTERHLEVFFNTILNIQKGADSNKDKGLGKKRVLTGFGSFSVSERPARSGTNPVTGEKIQLQAKRVVKFKAGADLSSKVN